MLYCSVIHIPLAWIYMRHCMVLMICFEYCSWNGMNYNRHTWAGGAGLLACLLFLLISFSLFFLFLRRRLMLLWKKKTKTSWTWPSLFALNYAWNHHNCKYQSMPTEKCKAREVMALGKYTFSHMMAMITVCAFCMHSWLNVVMLAFTAEFSAVLYSKIILFFLLELS